MSKVIISEGILILVGIASIIYWHRKIDSETTWIYGIYVIAHLIIGIFVFLGLQQYWLNH